LAYPNSTTRRWRVQVWKSDTLTTQWESHVYTQKRIRKLNPIECERLQTLPDNYTEWVSDSQRYKMLGNWWTVDVIAHIFSYLK
jgi:DNA (cytosine-5)-methyltransferase 3A